MRAIPVRNLEQYHNVTICIMQWLANSYVFERRPVASDLSSLMTEKRLSDKTAMFSQSRAMSISKPFELFGSEESYFKPPAVQNMEQSSSSKLSEVTPTAKKEFGQAIHPSNTEGGHYRCVVRLYCK